MHRRAVTGGKRVERTYTRQTRAYGVLMVRALTAVIAVARRETKENNFIAALEDEGYDEWEEGTNSGGIAAAQYLLL